MAQNNDNGEFKGSTKEAILDLKADLAEVKADVAKIRNWMLIITMLLTVAIIERLPTLVNLVRATL